MSIYATLWSLITGACTESACGEFVEPAEGGSPVVSREGQDAADTAATTEERAAAPVVTGVSPVVAWGAQDAADTAAITEERAVAPVVTGVSPVVFWEGQDAADTAATSVPSMGMNLSYERK